MLLQPLSENLVIVGLSYRHVPVATLGAHALPRHELTTRLPEIAKAIGATELAYIGTCNRITFVIVGPDSPELYRDRLSDMNGLRFRAWQGEGGMEHLLLVSSGLESARRGEPEIRNQVRAGWATARDAGTSGPVLNRLFAEVLKAATEVQSFIARSIGVVSLTDGALGRMNAHLQGRSATVAVIGVSPMTRRCATDLIGRGHRLIIASRTLATAEGMAAEIGGTPMTLDDLRRDGKEIDAVVAAVGGEKTVIGVDDIARWAPDGGLIAVDFGVPPNIDPAAAEMSGITLLDMDALISVARDSSSAFDTQLGPAREIVDFHLDRLRGEAALRQAAPAIEGVVKHHQALVQAGLAEIDTEKALDREALNQWADRMSRRFLHATLVGVRTLAADAGPGAVESFLRGLSSAVPPQKSEEGLS